VTAPADDLSPAMRAALADLARAPGAFAVRGRHTGRGYIDAGGRSYVVLDATLVALVAKGYLVKRLAEGRVTYVLAVEKKGGK